MEPTSCTEATSSKVHGAYCRFRKLDYTSYMGCGCVIKSRLWSRLRLSNKLYLLTSTQVLSASLLEEIARKRDLSIVVDIGSQMCEDGTVTKALLKCYDNPEDVRVIGDFVIILLNKRLNGLCKASLKLEYQNAPTASRYMGSNVPVCHVLQEEKTEKIFTPSAYRLFVHSENPNFPAAKGATLNCILKSGNGNVSCLREFKMTEETTFNPFGAVVTDVHCNTVIGILHLKEDYCGMVFKPFDLTSTTGNCADNVKYVTTKDGDVENEVPQQFSLPSADHELDSGFPAAEGVEDVSINFSSDHSEERFLENQENECGEEVDHPPDSGFPAAEDVEYPLLEGRDAADSYPRFSEASRPGNNFSTNDGNADEEVIPQYSIASDHEPESDFYVPADVDNCSVHAVADKKHNLLKKQEKKAQKVDYPPESFFPAAADVDDVSINSSSDHSKERFLENQDKTCKEVDQPPDSDFQAAENVDDVSINSSDYSEEVDQPPDSGSPAAAGSDVEYLSLVGQDAAEYDPCYSEATRAEANTESVRLFRNYFDKSKQLQDDVPTIKDKDVDRCGTAGNDQHCELLDWKSVKLPARKYSANSGCQNQNRSTMSICYDAVTNLYDGSSTIEDKRASLTTAKNQISPPGNRGYRKVSSYPPGLSTVRHQPQRTLSLPAPYSEMVVYTTRKFRPDEDVCKLWDASVDFRDNLSLLLDKSHSYGSAPNLRKVAELLEIPAATCDTFYYPSQHSPTEKMFGYLEASNIDLTVKDLIKALKAIKNQTAIGILKESMEGKMSTDCPVTELLEENPDVLGKLCLALDSGPKTWKELSIQLGIKHPIYNTFCRPSSETSPISELLVVISTRTPWLTANDLKEKLNSKNMGMPGLATFLDKVSASLPIKHVINRVEVMEKLRDKLDAGDWKKLAREFGLGDETIAKINSRDEKVDSPTAKLFEHLQCCFSEKVDVKRFVAIFDYIKRIDCLRLMAEYLEGGKEQVNQIVGRPVLP